MLFTPPSSSHCPPARPAGQGAGARAADEARVLMARDDLVQAASGFRVHPVERIRDGVLDTAGCALHAPALAQVSDRLTAVVAAACTLGPALERRVSALFAARQPGLAMALDTLGTDLLFRLSDRLYARIRREMRRQGLRVGPPQNPGDAGLALQAQPAVLQLSGVPATALCANGSGMLQPVKSLTFIAALGPDLPVHAVTPRCVRCAVRDRCTLRPQ
jgi:hypothetical protein